MMTSHRCHAHRLWDGETYDSVPDGQGGTVRVPAEFRFERGLRRDHAEALEGRADLAAKLHGMNLWGADADELDAAVDAFLAEAG